MRPRRSFASFRVLSAVTVPVTALAVLVSQTTTTTSFAIPPSPPAVGSAAPPSKEATKEASDRFKRGVELYKAGSYEQALIEFERAYQLAPNYRVLYNVGLLYRDSKDHANALKTFERYLSEGGAEIDAKRRAEVEADIAKLKDLVATVTVTTTVPGVEVFVDDVSIGTTPFTKPFVMNGGRRKFLGSKDGFNQTTKIVTIATRDNITVTLEMKELRAGEPPPPPPPTATTAAPPPPASAPPPAPPPPPSTAQRTAGYVALGVGGVGIVTGSIFGLIARGKWSSAKDDCPNNVCKTPESQSKAEDAKKLANVGTVGWVIGLVGVGVGTALVLTAPTAGSKETATLRVSPSVDPRGAGGVFFDGSFLDSQGSARRWLVLRGGPVTPSRCVSFLAFRCRGSAPATPAGRCPAPRHGGGGASPAPTSPLDPPYPGRTPAARGDIPRTGLARLGSASLVASRGVVAEGWCAGFTRANWE